MVIGFIYGSWAVKGAYTVGCIAVSCHLGNKVKPHSMTQKNRFGGFFASIVGNVSAVYNLFKGIY